MRLQDKVQLTAAILAGAVAAGGGSAVRQSPVATAAEGGTPVSTPVTDIGGRRQFWFNAQGLVAESTNLKVVQRQPAKHPANPLVVADKPWEGRVIQLYSSDVHYDPAAGQWQMWYEGHPAGVLLCTAFSKDGLKWSKPSLGLQEWKGSKENNIILQSGYTDAHCASIVRAPNEKDPARRYKLYYWVGPEWFESHIKPMGLKPDEVADVRAKIKAYPRNGHYVAFSPDGIHFTPRLEAPALACPPVSDFNTTLFDESSGRYRSYHKIDRKKPGWEESRRCMSMAESDDGVTFKPSVPVLDPTPEDDAWAKSLGGKRAEFYGMHVWPHEGFYLGLVWIFRVTKGNAEFGRGWDDGYNIPYLIYSPDGIDWKRMPEREPFIPTGPAGSFESGSVYSSGDHPVVIGDEVRFYYFGVNYTHGCTEPINSPKLTSGFGLATLGRDRYVAWQGGAAGGTLSTKPLKFAGRELHLNLESKGGETRVELLGADGKALVGFTAEDCDPISADSFDQVVKWRGSSDVSALAGKEIRVRFALRQSALYTWQFR
jgi:hypothetical protein